MAKGLQHYTITLITEGPLFIGSGKTIGKKEYIFDARRQLVHIPDLVKIIDIRIVWKDGWKKPMRNIS